MVESSKGYFVRQLCYSEGIGGCENHVKVLQDSFGDFGRQQGVKINHTHLPRADIVGYYRRLVHNERWVATVHGHYGQWRLKITIRVMFRMWSKADRVIAITEEVKRWLVWNGVPERKIVVIYYGINTPTSSSIPFSIGKTGGQCMIGSVGRLEPRKGHDILIQAMPTVLLHHPKAKLRIVGRDDRGYKSVLEDLITTLQLGRSVELIGELQHDQIPSFLRQITVYAQASREEGLGLAVLEAMAHGKVVVLSDIPAFREIVPRWQRVHKPEKLAKALVNKLKDTEDFRVRTGEALREHVRVNFSVDRMVRKIGWVYASIK